MKIFIWKEIDNLTNEYHRNGGLVIIAKDIEEARLVASSHKGVNDRCELPPPARTYEVDSESAEIFVFPNTGCC